MNVDVPFLLNTRFRTSSSFHLKEWNDLNAAEQKTLADLYDAGDVYGIFVPSQPVLHRTPKIAFRDAALLYLHLAVPNRLPHCFTAAWSPAIENTFAQLILDDILEVEWQGKFLSGSSAVAALYSNGMNETVVASDYLSRLSMQAISFVFPFKNLTVNGLTAKLYAFHTTPWDAVDKTAFLATQNVYQFLFSKADEEITQMLLQHWIFAPATKEVDWFSWSNSHVPETVFSLHSPTFKLYISPIVQHLPVVLQKAVPVLTTNGAFQFKIGASVNGLLRPDKMVAYFETKEALLEAAVALEKTLPGIGVQGVPFTSQVGENGLLSWGVDPPQTEALEMLDGGSWRTRVTTQLAAAILQAQSDKLFFKEAVPFIRARLYSNGIDMKNWTTMQDEN